jgi:ribonuclease BN (tRNA processing enzyme)
VIGAVADDFESLQIHGTTDMIVAFAATRAANSDASRATWRLSGSASKHDRTMVISGDTTPTQSVIDNCQDCDVLIHDSYSIKTHNAVSEAAQANRRRLHTSSMQLAELAGKVKRGLLILYHRSSLGGVLENVPNPEEAFLEEIRRGYAGKVVVGHDLDIY